MLLSIVYSIICLLTNLVLLQLRDGTARDIELLALRHEVRVLRRQTRRPPWRPGDRLVFAALSRCLPRTGWSCFPVRPETLLRWHRELVRRKWAAFGRRRHSGRPPLAAACRRLILQLAWENPRWGYQRIRGEVLRLGYVVSATTIRSVLWEDIHIEEREENGERIRAGHLVVRRKVYRLPKYVGGGIDYDEPKSEKGRRTIGLIPEVIEKLLAWKEQQEQERLLAGSSWKDGGWVFTWRNGGHLEGRQVDRAFQSALRRHGFKHLRVHDLRHSAVTTLLNASENLKAVQEFAGHASLSTTVDLYGHYIKGTEQKTAQTMREALRTGRRTGQ